MMYQRARFKLDKKTMGRRVKILILQQYKSVTDFALKSGIAINSLYKIIHGEVHPSTQTLITLSKYLGCTTDFVLGVVEPEVTPQEGLEVALMNIYQHRSSWTRGQRMFAIYTILGTLSPEEESKLRKKLGLE